MLCDVREHKLDLLSENEGKLNETLRKCKLTGKLEKQKTNLERLSQHFVLLSDITRTCSPDTSLSHK